MFDDSKKKNDTMEVNQVKNKEKEPTYYERVFLGKGTVAEDWPTAKELWDNIKDEAQEIQELLNSTNSSKK